MTSSTTRHLKDLRIVAIETSWRSPLERNTKFFTWAGMTPCIPKFWEGMVEILKVRGYSQAEWADHALTPQGSCVVHYMRSSMADRSRKVLFPGAWHWWGCIGHVVWNLDIAEGWQEIGGSPAEVYHSDQKWSEVWSTWLARMCWGMLRQVKVRLIKQPAVAWRVITSTTGPRFSQQHQMIQQ